VVGGGFKGSAAINSRKSVLNISNVVRLPDARKRLKPSKQKKVRFNFDTCRRREMEKDARDRGVGNTEDLDWFLIAWVQHNPTCKPENLPFAVIEAARRMGRNGMTEAEAVEIIKQARSTGHATRPTIWRSISG
jgi:hypothetical protein